MNHRYRIKMFSQGACVLQLDLSVSNENSIFTEGHLVLGIYTGYQATFFTKCTSATSVTSVFRYSSKEA